MRARLAETGADGLLVVALPNIRYLSGFAGSAAVLVVAADPPDLFFTDLRYRAQIVEEIDPLLEATVVPEKTLSVARKQLRERGVDRLAFERAHLSVAAWESFGEEGIDLVGADGWVEDLRAVKSPPEIDALRRAARIAADVFEPFLEKLYPGVTERALAAELDRRLIEGGAEGPAFSTTVAFGERAALPHARPSSRRLERGDVVLLDYGAVVEGYHSDLSRTVACGEPPGELAEVYPVVVAAQKAAIAGLAPGREGREVDALAREMIEEAGHGPRFAHSLGHGIGLEVHEAPRLGRTSEDRLEPQMVVTVEPGIYIDQTGGVRIEDDVLLGSRGVEVLTAAPKDELIVL